MNRRKSPTVMLFECIFAAAVATPVAIVVGFALDMLITLLIWVPWTVFELGQLYGYALPSVFQSIPFWHIFGLSMIARGIRYVVISRPVKIDPNKDN